MCTGQWVKILLPKEWGGNARNGAYQLDPLRSHEKGFYTTDNPRNCEILRGWKMWVSTSWIKYPGLFIFFSFRIFWTRLHVAWFFIVAWLHDLTIIFYHENEWFRFVSHSLVVNDWDSHILSINQSTQKNARNLWKLAPLLLFWAIWNYFCHLPIKKKNLSIIQSFIYLSVCVLELHAAWLSVIRMKLTSWHLTLQSDDHVLAWNYHVLGLSGHYILVVLNDRDSYT